MQKVRLAAGAIVPPIVPGNVSCGSVVATRARRANIRFASYRFTRLDSTVSTTLTITIEVMGKMNFPRSDSMRMSPGNLPNPLKMPGT